MGDDEEEKEDIAREDANLFCRLLFLGIVIIDTDDVNDDEEGEEEEEEKDEDICLE